MREVADLTRTAQRLLKRVTEDQLNGCSRHDLHDLAVKHGCAFQQIHYEIKELVDANFLRMERLGFDGSGMVQFHLSDDPTRLLEEINACAYGASE
ncbi:MAG: hypothetical protein ACSHW6_02775 [Sulfitobacter geojensis]